MITRLAHICIGSTDLEKSRHFYCDVLGMEKGFEFIKNGDLFGFYIKTGETTYIEIFIEEHEPNYNHPIMQHLCLEVADLDSVISTVRSRGWEITDKKMGGDKSWQAWMKDPCGVPIEVMQYTAESSQFTGTPCPVDW
jgi:catechol 2,3-dioxygenase-like lactoylglutathione lyase family enzyme